MMEDASPERALLVENFDESHNNRSYQSINSASNGSGEISDVTSSLSNQTTKPKDLTTNHHIDKSLRKRATFVSLLVAIMYMAALVPNDVLTTQYLVHRLAQDRNLNTSHTRVDLCGNQSDPTVKEANSLEEEASSWALYYTYANCLPSLVVCLLFGGFTDVVGRRPLLILTTLGGTVRMLGAVLMFKFSLPLWFGYIGAIIDGLTGGLYGYLLASFATIADVNEEKSVRVFWITVFTVVMSVDSSVFNVVSGLLIDYLGFVPSGVMCAAAMAIGFLCTLVFFPETCPMSEKRVGYSPVENLRRIAGFFILDGSARKKIRFFLCVTAFFTSAMNVLSISKINTLYQMHEPFCWSSSLIGIYYGATSTGQYVIGLVLLKALQLCFNVEWIALIGSLFQGGSFVLEALITTDWQFVLVSVVGILGSTTVPIVRGLASALVSSKDQGALFSSIAIIEVVCMTIANTAILNVYSSTIGTMPGAVFLLMGSFSFSAALILLIFLCIRDDKDGSITKIK